MVVVGATVVVVMVVVVTVCGSGMSYGSCGYGVYDVMIVGVMLIMMLCG